MSRDPSGNYSLPPIGASGAPINPVQPSTIITTDWARTTLNDIALALTNSLDRQGKGGMGAPLVMNGYKITSIGPATLPEDAPQAQQVRDQSFIWLTSVASNGSGNDYVGTALLKNAPVNGAMYQFLADRTNTGPMTLAVNGSAGLPVLLHGGPVPPGLVLAGAVIPVVYVDLTYRLISIAPGTGTVNSVQSSDTQLISVVNDTSVNIATLTPHSNVAFGMLKLDSGGKVPPVQLPFSDIHFVGIWNAAAGTLPPTALYSNGDFFIITVDGTLTIFRDSGTNVYTAQSTAVVVGDAIVLRKGSVDPNAPDGWYFDPGVARPAVGSTVAITPTSPLFPGISNLQSWLDNADPAINDRLLRTGGTLSGAVHSVPAGTPGSADELVNKQYVDSRVLAAGGVSSFNGRQGAVTLTSPDVTGALGYTPANLAGASFTGGINAPNVNAAGFITSGKGFYMAPDYGFIAAGNVTVDFANGQSQIYYLNAATNITSVDNIPGGAILRLIVANTNIPHTWPGNVHWPLGVLPDLAAGPLKRAIVVFENDDGTNILATASIY